jgi:uncharacterized protein YqgC (DUF456 family)
MWTTVSIIICSIFMIVGLLGAVVPLIPGVPIAWLGLFIYAIATGFERISIAVTVIFFVLMLLTVLLDFLAPMLGASKYRASRWGIIGAFLGFIVGIFVLGFWGIIFGPLVGAFLGELIARKKPKQALGSALGAFLGFIAGVLFKIILVLIMAGFFIASFIS